MVAYIKKSFTSFILMMLVGTMIPMSFASAATLNQTITNVRVVEGTTDQPNQHVTIVANQQVVTTMSDATKKYSYTFDDVPVGQIAVYQRDHYGFDQLIDVTIRPKPKTPEMLVKPQDATFIGVIDNDFVFVTHPDHTIHATYDGQTKEGIGELYIPKNKAETVSVYVSSPEKASTPIKSYEAAPANPDVIQLNETPHETLRVSGTALPYVTIFIRLDDIVRTGQADASGKFDFPFTGWEQRAYEQQTYTVQAMHFVNKAEGVVKEFTIPAFNPTDTQPILIIEESLTQFSGVTYPNAEILLDGEQCETSEDSGYFDCHYAMNEQVDRILTIQKDGQILFTKQVKVKRNDATMKFEKVSFELEDAQLIGKATPNQTFGVWYWDRANTSYDNYQIHIQAKSDAQGNIVFNLPKQYEVDYMVSYVDEEGLRTPKGVFRADDNRMPPTPILKMDSNQVAITIPPFHYPYQFLWFEAKIDKESGRSFTQKVFPNNPVLSLDVNDKFIIRTVLYDGRVSEWVKGSFDAIQKPLIPDLTNDTTVLKGTTEPNASLKFTNGVLKEMKADAQGKFEFAVNLKKVNAFNVLVSVLGKPDQTFKYEVKDTVRPTLRVYDVLSDIENQIDVEASEYIGDFTIAYYKGTTLLREGIVKPLRSLSDDSSGFKTFAQLPVSNLKSNGVTHLIVKAKDRSGNWSEGNKVTVKDITRPKLTQQKYVLAGEHVIYGKTEPGARVTFTYRSDKEKTVTVSKTGDFTIKTTDPIYSFKDGKHYSQVKITSMDAAGNQAYAYVSPVGEKVQDIRVDGGQNIWFYSPLDQMIQNQYEFTVNGTTVKQNQMGNVITWPNDIKLPATVTVKLINPDKTIKYEVTKTVTKPYIGKNVSNVKFQSGSREIHGVGEAHATLEVWSGSSRIGSTSIDATGKFNLNLIRVYNEGESLDFVTSHKLGRASVIKINAKDNTAPTAPSMNEITANSTQVSGKTEKGATVFITYNGKTYTTKATSTGSYVFKIKQWLPAKVVSVHVKDLAGNQSPATRQTIKYVFKQFSVNTLRTTHTYVTGKGHPGATVQVYNGASKVGKAVKVDAKGNFKAYVNKQRQGNVLTVEMTHSGYASKRSNTTVQR